MGDLQRLTKGKPLTLGDADDPDGKLDPQGKSYSARDFSYDKTGLPRYPDAVVSVASSISYGPDGRTDRYTTGAAIVTSSSFDTVVAWYQKQLPAGWHDQTVGDLGALASQFSMQNIGKMLGVPANGTTAPAGSAATASAPAEVLRISIFSPPAGTPNEPAVMIVQHGDRPVEALYHAKVWPKT